MIVVRFKVRCEPEKTEQVMALAKDVIAPTRARDGVVSFDIGRDLADRDAFIATEVFEDRAALDRQESLPEVATVMAVLPDSLAAEPDATIFHVSSSEPYGGRGEEESLTGPKNCFVLAKRQGHGKGHEHRIATARQRDPQAGTERTSRGPADRGWRREELYERGGLSLTRTFSSAGSTRASPDKQRVATELLRAAIGERSVFVAHQAIVEFLAAVTRPVDGTDALLDPADARREAEELPTQFDVLYSDQDLVRIHCEVQRLPALVVRRANLGLCRPVWSRGVAFRGLRARAPLRHRVVE